MKIKKFLITPDKQHHFKWYIIAVALMLLYFAVSQTILNLLGLTKLINYEPNTVWPTLPFILSTCLLPAIWEEALYRVIPLTIAWKAGRKKYLLPTMIGTSILFGWDHHYGIWGILVQGAVGFISAMLFVKTNRSYFYSALFHFTWNMACLYYLDNFKIINFL